MINILCFGNSNTFGTRPGGGRWPLYRRAAEAWGWLFLDAAETAGPSPRDLLHMEAEALEGVIRRAFEEEGGRWQRKI